MTAFNAYPREFVGFAAFPVYDAGAVVASGVSYSVVSGTTRPTSFIAAVVVGGETGITISGYAPGWYRVYGKVSASPQFPVVDCGQFKIL